jgi:hypothetical protein
MLKISIGKITKDKEGNLYIGDFEIMKIKEDLCIYKIAKTLLKPTKASYKVSFEYPEKKFPPKEESFDVESFFEFKNNFIFY